DVSVLLPTPVIGVDPVARGREAGAVEGHDPLERADDGRALDAHLPGPAGGVATGGEHLAAEFDHEIRKAELPADIGQPVERMALGDAAQVERESGPELPRRPITQNDLLRFSRLALDDGAETVAADDRP